MKKITKCFALGNNSHLIFWDRLNSYVPVRRQDRSKIQNHIVSQEKHAALPRHGALQ